MLLFEGETLFKMRLVCIKQDHIFYLQSQVLLICGGSDHIDLTIPHPNLLNREHLIRVLRDRNLFLDFQLRSVFIRE